MALQQESPEQKEARMERMREYCKQNPDTEGCDEVLAEEEVNTDSIVEVGQMAIIMSGLSSSMCLVVVVMMLMRKR
jgi:hypothetical protein